MRIHVPLTLHSYPLDSHLMWNALCVAMFLNLSLTIGLPLSLNKPRAEAEQDEMRVMMHEAA